MDLINQIIAELEAALQSLIGSFQSAPTSMDIKSQVRDAIYKGITVPLALPNRATDILYFQSTRETANFTAWYFSNPQQPDGKPPTFSLYNRRVGSGRGEWTHQVKLIHGDDTRIFTDVYQSARDMAELLQDPLYADALVALQNGDGPAYFNALEGKFSARLGDYAAYGEQFSKEYA